MNSVLPPFHLAIKTDDLASSRRFYSGLLGCEEGRSAKTWVDFNFFGHQLVCHLAEDITAGERKASNEVDGHDVPVPHFGVVLDMQTWERVARNLLDHGIRFIIEPYVRFKGQPGEQATMFLLDPAGNPLEFKAFRDVAGQLFEK